MKTFFLAGTKVEAGAKAGAGTRGIEIEAGVTEAVEITGTVGIAGIEAKVTLAIGIAGIAEIRAEAGTGVALEIEAFPFYAWLNKNSR
jgi:hypothetical protein